MQRACSLAIALVLCFAGFDQANAWVRDNNTDRPGADYRNFEIPPRKNSIAGDGVADKCEEACRQDRKCAAWVAFVRPGVQSANGKCWLKVSIPAAQTNNCCTSGGKLIRSTGKAGSGTSTTSSTPGSTFTNKILEYSRGSFRLSNRPR